MFARRPRSRTSLNSYPPPPSSTRRRSRSRDSSSSYTTKCIDPIILLDNTVTPGENSPSLWARSVQVSDYVIVTGGGRTRTGAYVLWSCYIDTLEVCLCYVVREHKKLFHYFPPFPPPLLSNLLLLTYMYNVMCRVLNSLSAAGTRTLLLSARS